MWRLGIDSRVPTCFRPESLTTAGQAQCRYGAQNLDASFRCLRAAYQALEAILPGEALVIAHARGHAGDPWNEFVDAAAKQEMNCSMYMTRQNIDMRAWIDDLPYLWTFLDDDAGLPPLGPSGHTPMPPDLPVAQPSEEIAAPTTRVVDFKISFCSANVASLYRGSQGHGGKIDYLRRQTIEFGMNLLGLQKARSEAGMSCVDGILRLAGGAQKHLFGIELWVNLTQPFAYIGRKPCYFRKQDFVIVFADPRLMITHVVNDLIDCWIVVAYGPHSGRPITERETWWSMMHVQICHFVTNQHIYVLMDANATSGSCDSVRVGHHDDEDGCNTIFLRNLLSDHDLCLPATFDCHDDTYVTWISPDGQIGKRIDFVAIPQCCLTSCMRSSVVEDFDLGNEHDHNAVGVDLQWRQTHVIAHRRGRDNLTVPSASAQAITKIPKNEILDHAIPPWNTNIGDQVEDFNGHVHRLLASTKDGIATPWKKPYITKEIWAQRETKIAIKRELKNGRKEVHSQILRTLFSAWRFQRHQDALDWTETFATQRVRNVCNAAKLWRATRQLRHSLKTTKADALRDCIEQLPAGSSSSTILRTLRPHIGPTNPHKAKKAALPIVRQTNGTPCLTPQDALNRWIEHFMTMEGGKRVNWQEQQELWIEGLRQIQASDVHLRWQDLPSLTDLEQACRQVHMDKATGPDHVPSSFVHLHSKEVAKLLYAQLVKLTIHGQEALVHKGGRLAVAFKGKGLQDRCESYRSLLVSSHPGKVLHKTLRTACTSIFSKYMQRQQLGGRKHVPVSFAVHMARYGEIFPPGPPTSTSKRCCALPRFEGGLLPCGARHRG